MTDLKKAAQADPIKAIEDALAAPDLPPGPWSWWTSCSFRRLSSDATGKDGDVLYASVHRDGVGDIEATAGTKAYIAACNPAAIAELLARLKAAEADAERLDWIAEKVGEKSGVWMLPCGESLRFVQLRHFGDCENYPTVEGLRAAIDAAMKETP